MNKRALSYLGAFTATLSAAFLYIQFKAGADSPEPVSGTATPATTSTGPGFDTQNYVQAAAALPLIKVRDGKLVTPPMRLRVKSGEVARFQVLTDHDDELHIHGINLQQPLKAGQLHTIELPTQQTGAFEVELHHKPVELGVLEVHPT